MAKERIIDLELVQRAQRGEREAFNVLVTKYQRRVFRLILRLLGDPAEAEDVVQETFIKAYRALPQFRGDSAFYTWLYRIAVNAARNSLELRGRRLPEMSEKLQDDETFEFSAYLNASETPEGLLLGKQIADVVQMAMDGLPEEWHQALSMREIDGKSYDEIAKEMGCPIGTVRSRIFRAREAIAEKIRPLLADGVVFR